MSANAAANGSSRDVKLRHVLGRMEYVPRALALVWAAAPGWTIAWAGLLVLQGTLPAVSIYLTRLLVDHATQLVGIADVPRDPTFVLLAVLFGGVLLLAELLESVLAWVRSAQAEHTQDHISTLVHAQSSSIDLAFYESPDYYDQLHRARDDARDRPLALLESLGRLLQNSITLGVMSVMLMPYALWLPLALIGSTVPALFVSLQADLRYHDWWLKKTSVRRWADYYDWMLIDGAGAAELRIFGLGPRFQAAYQALRQRLRSERLRLLRRQLIGQLGAGTAGLLVAATTMAWMLWRALYGLVSLGDLVLLYQVFHRGQTVVRQLFIDVGQIYSNSLFLGNLFAFLELRPQMVDPRLPVPAPLKVERAISFHNVSFRYPGSERPALENFSLTIPAGRIVAVVGPNGAGKSTLVKLLCRLYEPEAGTIRWDGVELQRFAVADLRQRIGVLLQQPTAYQATVAQNIALDDALVAADMPRIVSAARSAGVDEIVRELPQGYDTLLGKWFASGTELSGGEWQRVALARAFLRSAPLLLLDEPTSFLDPWTEAAWFERFRAVVASQTALIITHRLSIARCADIICVVDEGRVIESGSHAELLKLGGRYAQSWQAHVQSNDVLCMEIPYAAVV